MLDLMGITFGEGLSLKLVETGLREFFDSLSTKIHIAYCRGHSCLETAPATPEHHALGGAG
jgi:hypothetical protein